MAERSEAPKESTLARLRVPVLTFFVACGLGLAFGARLGLILPPEGLSASGLAVAGVVIVMAASWMFEGLPIAATALLPLVLLPVLGVSEGKTVARSYMSSAIMLFMGGFFLAKGLERWGVPQRMALVVSRWASGSAVRLVVGLMAFTTLLSMWVSNTATTLIMITVALAAISRARLSPRNKPEDVKRFSYALVLGIAYAANVGGLGTPVGTPPNVIMLGLHKQLSPLAPQISFLEWMVLALPVVVVIVPIIAFLLIKVLTPFPSTLDIGQGDEGALPPLGSGGRRALAIFLLVAVAWVLRADIDLGPLVLPGWAGLLGLRGFVDDGVVAMAGVALMFACPSGEGRVSGAVPAGLSEGPVSLARRLHLLATDERVLTWETANTIPWYIVVLFGGGLALADAFGVSGLSTWMGDQLVWLHGAPPWLIVFALCFGMSLLTEVTSNTATTTLVLPVLFATAEPLGVPPLLLMWPATLCASAAFILPISTPPNAIAAGAVDMKPIEMARVGVGLNMIAVVLVTAVTMLWMAPRLGL